MALSRFRDDEDDELLKLQEYLGDGASQASAQAAPSSPDIDSMQLQPDREPLDSMQLDPDIAPEDHALIKLSRLDGADDMGPMPSADDRAAERRHIDSEGGGALGSVARGISSVVPDIGTIAALGLDAGFNRGRGAGEIVGAYANNRAAAAAKAKDPFEQLVALERLKQGQQRIEGSAEDRGRKDKQLGLQTDKWGQATDIDSAKNTVDIEKRERLASAGAKGRIEEENALKDVQADTRGTVAAAETNAKTDALRGNPVAITPQQEISNKLDQVKLDLDAEKEARTKEKQDIDWSDDFSKKHADMIKIAQASRKLDEIFGKHKAGEDVPGIGSFESYQPDWMLSARESFGNMTPEQKAEADEIRTLQASLRSFQGKEITGAAAGGKEESQRIGRLSGTAGGMDEAQVRSATSDLRKTAEQALRAAASGRPELAKKILAQSGLDDLIGDAPAAGAPATRKSEAARQKFQAGQAKGVRSVGNPDSWAPLGEGDEDDVYRRWR